MRISWLGALPMVAACVGGGEGGNAPPVIEPAAVTTDEDQAEKFVIVAWDPDGDPLELTMRSESAGTYDLEAVTQAIVDGANRLEVEVRLRPYPDYHGETSFPIAVTDGVERVTGAVSVVIHSVNDEPTVRDDAFATPAGAPIAIAAATLLLNDDDAPDLPDDVPANTGLAIESAGAATHGAVAIDAGAIVFTPAPDFTGTAQFVYAVTDGTDATDAIVRVSVGVTNAAPFAVADESFTMEGTPLDLRPHDLLGNDSDEDGHTLAIVAVGNAEHGTVEFLDGVVRFTPEASYFGPARFDYTITDGAATSTAPVAVEIAPYI